jgi:hypothetical protein
MQISMRPGSCGPSSSSIPCLEKIKNIKQKGHQGSPGKALFSSLCMFVHFVVKSS